LGDVHGLDGVAVLGPPLEDVAVRAQCLESLNTRAPQLRRFPADRGHGVVNVGVVDVVEGVA